MSIKGIWREFFVEQEVTVRKKINTVPNMITGAGILLTVLYIFMYALGYKTSLVLAVVFLVMLSDLLDGFAARRLNQHTVLGKDLDSLRDQLLKFAIIGNIAWVSQDVFVIAGIVLLSAVEIRTIFLKRVLKNTGKSGSSHTIGKLRLLFLYIFGAIFLFKTYSGIEGLVLADTAIVALMLAASLIATAAFTTAIVRKK